MSTDDDAEGYPIDVAARDAAAGGGFVASAPDFPGVSCVGKTADEAVQRCRTVIRRFLRGDTVGLKGLIQESGGKS
ncbi:MAG: hypothetical protein JNK11_08365 [Alphaproteobacteria bacterium]|nr:hypothetical protein [Alphaproteobacteria bacterium]